MNIDKFKILFFQTIKNSSKLNYNDSRILTKKHINQIIRDIQKLEELEEKLKKSINEKNKP